jgi:hypothetical protein
MKEKIEIKSVFRAVLFTYECENNTICKTVEKAISSGANLRYADLRYAYLRDSDLSGADLRDAELRYADLSDSDLSSADLSYADLSGADLSGANLRYAELRYADLRDSDLSGADYNEGTTFLLSQCPSEGSFIGWKKCGNYIVKLLITENSKRSSSTSLKCRCSEAKTLEIQEIDGSKSGITEICSNRDSEFIYKVGEVSEVPNFEKDRWNECSSGIHFFISREMAVKYLIK